ncbi:MAG: hypothetical protein ACHREM_20615 [Polyangiales bacterium]
MHWQSSDGNGNTLDYYVTGVTSVQTLSGTRNVWGIQGPLLGGPTQAHLSGSFVEGRGTFDGSGFTVFPLDDPPASSAYPTVSPTPLNDGKPVATQFRGLNASAHLDPSTDPQHPWRIRFGGWSPIAFNGALVEALSVHCTRTDGATFVEEARQWDYQVDNETADQTSYFACPDAAAVAFDSTGAVQHGRNDYDGLPIAFQLDVSGADLNFHPMLAMFAGFGGTPTVLMATTGSTWGRALSLGDADPSAGNIDHATERVPTRHQNVMRRGFGLNVQRAIVADVAPGATETGAILAARGRLLEARITADGVDGVQALGSNEARYSTTASPTSRTHLLVSPDGRIDRVHLAPSGTTFEPLALVPLQSRETLVGALMLDDTHLTVLVEHDYAGVAGLTLATLNYGVYASSVTLAAPSAAAPPSVLSSLQGDLSGDDVVLCVRAGAGPWSTDGWTIHGVATKAVVAGDRCLVVLNTPRPGGTIGRLPSGSFTVEGPVPGSGRVEVSIASVRESTAPVVAYPGLSAESSVHAPLAAGGFTSDAQRYTDGAVSDGEQPALHESLLSANMVADAAGNGLWATAALGGALPTADEDTCTGSQGCVDLMLVAEAPHHLRVGLPTAAPAGVLMHLVAPVGGGGVILEVGADVAFVRPDASARLLPKGRQYVGGLANGTFCGMGSAGFECIDASGNVRPVPTLVDPIPLGILLPTEDGMLFTGYELIDPTGPTITVKELFVPGAGGVAPVAHNDASGALFVGEPPSTVPGTLSRIRGGALELVATIDKSQVSSVGGADFIVDRVSFLMLNNGLPYRIAR